MQIKNRADGAQFLCRYSQACGTAGAAAFLP
jgi:hypothetical protein